MLIGAPLGFFGGGVAAGWDAWTGASNGSNVDVYSNAVGTCAPKLATQIATGKVILAFTGWSGAQSIYAIAGTVSGNSVSYGSVALVASEGISAQAAVCQMATDMALVAYRKRTDAAHCNVLTASGTTVSVGTQSSEFTATKGASDIDLAPLTSTTALLVYNSNGSGVYGRVVTISGTSVSSFGSEVNIDSGITTDAASVTCVALSSTVALVMFGRGAGLTCVKLSISGTTITVGNNAADASISLATGQAKNVRIAKMSSTTAVFHAAGVAASVIGVVTASGATPSFGSETSLPSTYTYADIAYDTNVSGGVAMPTAGAAYGYSVSGTTVTVGSAVVVKTATNFGSAVALIAETGKMVAEYSYSGATTIGTAVLNK